MGSKIRKFIESLRTTDDNINVNSANPVLTGGETPSYYASEAALDLKANQSTSDSLMNSSLAFAIPLG